MTDVQKRRIKSAFTGNVSRQEPLMHSELEGTTNKDSHQYITMAAKHSDMSVQERNARYLHSSLRL